MSTDIEKLQNALRKKKIRPSKTADGQLTLNTRDGNTPMELGPFLTEALKQNKTVCPERLKLVAKYRAKLKQKDLPAIIAHFTQESKPRRKPKKEINSAPEPPSISPPELPKKEKKEKKDKKDKDNSLPTPQPDPEPEIVEEPALPEEIELYTAEELEAMDWADIRSVAKADEEVPGNVSKDEMIKLLTGRPKFPIA